MNHFDIVRRFEIELAKYYNAPFCVATDSCTHAVELSLRMDNPDKFTTDTLSLPTRTYISIPMTMIKLGLKWNFQNTQWKDYYFIVGTRIIDAAVCFDRNTYIDGSLMCLSFQHKKMLSLGRGGAILCSNKDEYTKLKRMAYDGRIDTAPWTEQNIAELGYHYYMTPETAQLGLEKIETVKPKRKWSSNDYPYLPDMEIFKNV